MTFCKSPLWDSNVTWYTGNPDFTVCFHETVLVYVPCALLWILAPWQIWLCRQSKNRNIPWSLLNILRLGSTSILLLLTLVDLILELTLGNVTSAAACIAPVILTLTFGLAIFLTLTVKRFGLTSSGILFLFWTLLTLTSTLTFASVIVYIDVKWREDQLVFQCFYFPIVILVWFLHFWADPKPKYQDISGKPLLIFFCENHHLSNAVGGHLTKIFLCP